ncbi:lysophospholipid acyltransferase family protein [Oceanobacillus halotolerans]|uniref:lysophospholipid acyltransferase family protein n=1 Tax=Oceanobacillus halotolerans TaxID=2663380 RepID=UPI0013DCF71C|nr:lysophospholipid acyltransferase family protein [Oceanobacillus halotolerans]
MSLEKKPTKWIENILRFCLKIIISRRTKIVVEQNDTLNMEGPYFILSNHVNNWDPFFINLFVKEPISYITGEPLFRNPLLKRILNYIGAIPKTKYINDTRTIRSIIKAKKHNRIIGIFPEGNRNWDGNTESFPATTAKLIKRLEIPVVIVTIKGGHLSHPRWAKNNRKGTIYLSMVKLFDKEDLSDISPNAIHREVSNALHHNESKWQKEKLIPYKGKELANYLERFLFVCPHCHTPGKLQSNNDLFQCQHCLYTVRYNPYGYFDKVNHDVIHSTTNDWNRWQLKFITENLQKQQIDWKELMQDHVKLFVSENGQPFSLLSNGLLTWDLATNNQLSFVGDDKEDHTFPIEQIEGLNIQLHHRLDFFVQDKLYRLLFYQPRTSAYKWLNIIQAKMEVEQKKKEVFHE